jgi:hypothetical protein
MDSGDHLDEFLLKKVKFDHANNLIWFSVYEIALTPINKKIDEKQVLEN